MKVLLTIPAVCLLLFACSDLNNLKEQNQTVTLVSLLNEMTDFYELMLTPEPNYKCVQFSSYDRRSTDPNNKTETNWFANSDIGNFIRIETNNGKVEYVMADVDGPGAVVRIWSANSPGTIRIYLDNSLEPEIEISMKKWLSGEDKRFPPPIAGARGIGKNSYMPIPFAKYCKITSSARMVYYHVDCRVYKGNVNVETFSLKQLEENSQLVKKTAEILENPEKLLLNPKDYNTLSATNTLQPGSSFSFSSDSSKNNEIIYNFECKILKGDLENSLRGCLLEVTFDNMKEPAVQAPLGDFFATAPGLNKFKSLPLGVLGNGTMYCHFLMPFKKKCSFKFTNTTTNEISLTYNILLAPYNWTERSQYFFAKWRAWFDYPTRPQVDLDLFSCKGKGKYVGNMFQISNPVPNWWGEGDEKVYIDGEKFPSIFGTGAEDYYGYAYCWCEPFSHAYHNQVRVDGPANFGHSCVSRFHFLDAFTFDKSIKFDFELWHHANTKVSIASTVYWYGDKNCKDNFSDIKKEQLTISKLPKMKKIPGAIEGEKMKVIKMSSGKISTSLTGDNCIDQQRAQNDGSIIYPCLMAGWQCTSRSEGHALWWIDFNKGDELVLQFLSDKSGTNEVLYSGTQGRIFGDFDIYINGEPAEKPLNLFAKKVLPVREIRLGKFLIKKGKNEIKIVPIRKDNKNKIFVLDCLILQKVN